MNFLGVAATAAAYVNYKDAKSNYEALKERAEGLDAVVQTYGGEHLLDGYYRSQTLADERQDNDMPEGILISSILRVGNLVGKLMRVQPTVVLSNAGDKPIQVDNMTMTPFIFDSEVSRFTTGGLKLSNYVSVVKIIKPGETIELDLEKALSTLVVVNENEDGTIKATQTLEQLRDVICDACGKKLITSCPKIWLNGVVKANFIMRWADNGIIKTAYWNGMPGTLRYCGEAYL